MKSRAAILLAPLAALSLIMAVAGEPAALPDIRSPAAGLSHGDWHG